MPNISIWEILLLLLVLLLVFGPKRLPEMGRSLGHSMREFKDSITGKGKDEEAEEAQVALATPATVVEATPAPTVVEATPAPTPVSTSETDRV